MVPLATMETSNLEATLLRSLTHPEKAALFCSNCTRFRGRSQLTLHRYPSYRLFRCNDPGTRTAITAFVRVSKLVAIGGLTGTSAMDAQLLPLQ